MAYELKDKSGEVVKHQGEQVLGQDVAGVIKSIDTKNRKMTIIGSDESVDRSGDIIRVNGWMLGNYQKNPVFLWAHNYSSVPLAATEKIVLRRVPTKHMEHTVKFPSEGIHPFSDMIFQLYGQKVINACSVGFIPKKFQKREMIEGEDEEEYKQYWGPREFIKQELLELSGCAVPANPNALQNALKSLGISFGVTEEGLDVPEEYLMPKKADDVRGELNVKNMEIVDETEPKIHQVPDQIESSTTPSISSSDIQLDNFDEEEEVAKLIEEMNDRIEKEIFKIRDELKKAIETITAQVNEQNEGLKREISEVLDMASKVSSSLNEKESVYDVILSREGKRGSDSAEAKPVDAQLEKQVEGLIKVVQTIKKLREDR